MEKSINQKIKALRVAMQKANIDAYIIPSSDPHQSEYVTNHWKTREWFSGFTGSAGTLVVTKDHAGLWTDGRYFLQATAQLEGTIIEMMQYIPPKSEHQTWLRDNLPPNSIIGIDGQLFSNSQVERLRNIVRSKNIQIDSQQDLIAAIWDDRPTLPKTPIFEHHERFTGKSRKKKIRAIQEKMEANGCNFHLLTALDDIAWTLNIRGSDIDFNPLAIAFAVIGKEVSYLFIHPEKVPASLRQAFDLAAIVLKPYEAIDQFLKELPNGKILIDPNKTNAYLYNLIPKHQMITGKSIPTQLKAIKNETEIAHIRKAMIKDGVALVRLYRWLEKELTTRKVSEYELAEQLIAFRQAQDHYYGESFPAIVGYNANGAIIHYRPMPDTCAWIEKSGILLLDSGGQYHDGTTDITRTICLGNSTEEQKRNFTFVLKGHIELASLIFPRGTRGIQVDILARHALWQHRLNYGHGTGHGVGFFLNVHEPPQSISGSMTGGGVVLEEGMLTSNEPGFYKSGEYGIRTENLILVVADETNEYDEFLKFETLTLFPIDKKLIDLKLLSNVEIDWLNQYHQKVEKQLLPYLLPSEQRWLKEKCREIG